MSSIKTFRYVALAEATSFLLLLVASYFKNFQHSADAETAVLPLGMIHGLLFVAYVVLALNVREPAGWSNKITFRVLLGAVLPFGGYFVDRWLARTGQLEAA